MSNSIDFYALGLRESLHQSKPTSQSFPTVYTTQLHPVWVEMFKDRNFLDRLNLYPEVDAQWKYAISILHAKAIKKGVSFFKSTNSTRLDASLSDSRRRLVQFVDRMDLLPHFMLSKPIKKITSINNGYLIDIYTDLSIKVRGKYRKKVEIIEAFSKFGFRHTGKDHVLEKNIGTNLVLYITINKPLVRFGYRIKTEGIVYLKSVKGNLITKAQSRSKVIKLWSSICSTYTFKKLTGGMQNW